MSTDYLKYSMAMKEINNIISPNDFQKLCIINKVIELKLKNPKVTQNELSKELNISKRILSRIASDIGYKFRGFCENKNIIPKTERSGPSVLDPRSSGAPMPSTEQCDICKNMFTKRGLSTHKRLKHTDDYYKNLL